MLQSLKANCEILHFHNADAPIRLVASCAYFIVINSGYADRQELADNLKVLFRGVKMIATSRHYIDQACLFWIQQLLNCSAEHPFQRD